MFYVLLALMISSACLWVVMHLKERRRMVNGITFLIAVVSLGAIVMMIGIIKGNDFLKQLPIFVFMFLVVLIPIVLVALIILLMVTGVRVIKREGFNIAHSLSLLLGLTLIGCIAYLPFFNMSSSGVINFFAILLYVTTAYFMIGLVVFIVASILNYASPYRYNKDYIIVLGSGLIEGEVTPLLASRIDKAIKLYQRQIEKGQPAPKIIMSGGQGPDEPVAEAVAMREYALKQNVAASDLMIEDKSVNTDQNLLFSHQIMQANKSHYRAVFVTSNYHVFRAALIARRNHLAINGRGARVKTYYFITATIREYIAVLVMNKKVNFIAALIIFAISVFLYATIM